MYKQSINWIRNHWKQNRKIVKILLYWQIVTWSFQNRLNIFEEPKRPKTNWCDSREPWTNWRDLFNKKKVAKNPQQLYGKVAKNHQQLYGTIIWNLRVSVLIPHIYFRGSMAPVSSLIDTFWRPMVLVSFMFLRLLKYKLQTWGISHSIKRTQHQKSFVLGLLEKHKLYTSRFPFG